MRRSCLVFPSPEYSRHHYSRLRYCRLRYRRLRYLLLPPSIVIVVVMSMVVVIVLVIVLVIAVMGLAAVKIKMALKTGIKIDSWATIAVNEAVILSSKLVFLRFRGYRPIW